MVRRWLGVSATLVALGTCFAAGRMVAAKDDGGPPRIGRFIRVALPIDSESVNLRAARPAAPWKWPAKNMLGCCSCSSSTPARTRRSPAAGATSEKPTNLPTSFPATN